MISHLSATYVYPVTGPVMKDAVLAVDQKGTIKNIYTAEQAEELQIKGVKRYDGLLVPGFINTHCHLELSNLRGKIPKHTGLPEFVQSVIRSRTSDEYELNLAMLSADIEMHENGIVAVGDISNQLISKSIKVNSPVYYFTFLELMGFNPAVAKEAMARAEQFKADFNPLPVSIVPHAPYSVSPDLLREINDIEGIQDGPITIHNQETADENAFFEQKTGGFLSLFEFLGQDISFFKPSGKTSLQTYLSFLSPTQKTLLVHNTYTTAADAVYAQSVNPNLYWCLCPQANLYIENRLPDVDMMRKENLRITLGTDSLASNEALNILSEMNLLQERFGVPTEELLKWATFNGAEFLEIESRFGSLEKDKQPGINLVDFTLVDGQVILGNTVKRLF